MITAKEAKKQSVFNSALQGELEKIEGAIQKAIDEGKFRCRYAKWSTYTKEEETMILEELRSHGFKAEYDRNEQPGCPCDQMDPYSYLKISWED